jgi:glycosyltransferase involved in cell wall biosynthesis
MRILFLTQVMPFPLDAGPKVRAYHVLRYLAEAGHRIHLLSFSRPGESEQLIQPLRRLCTSIDRVPLVRSRLRDVRDGVRSVFGSTPFLVQRDQVAAMWEKLRQVVSTTSFDALHLDQLWMAPYGMNGIGPGLRVLDQHNAVFMVPRRMAEYQRNLVARALLRNEASKLQAFERDACGRFDRVVWVTDEDRRAVLPGDSDRGHRDAVIPIATDPQAQPRLRGDRPFRVTFLGGLHWPPNSEGMSWFIEKVWSRVVREAPSAVLTVIGRGGEKVPGLQGARQVEVTGYVDDPQRYLAETAVFVVPLLSGAGMRVKILDAWCWGLPIVSTTVGAEGLRATHDENILLADDGEAFATAVVNLIKNGRLATRLADNGRATVEAHYDWKTLYTAWDRIYQS